MVIVSRGSLIGRVAGWGWAVVAVTGVLDPAGRRELTRGCRSAGGQPGPDRRDRPLAPP